MEPREEPGRQLAQAYGLSALGFTFGAAVVVFTGIGWLLDRRLGTVPLFTIVAALTGAVLGFLNVYFRIRRQLDDGAERQRKERR
jgi:F0F1-type ATP synthase assembly protein I